MKKFFFLTVLFIFISCSSPKGIILPPEPAILASLDIKPSSIKNPEPETQVPEKQRLFFSCEEKTKSTFNSSGFEVLPFIRTISYDIDNDGTEELIAGSKDGFLRLYKRSVINDTPGWTLIEKYFDGIKARAFSAPAVGDIDNDGKPEIILGTGGFSSESGKVIFYKNTGSFNEPLWEKLNFTPIDVGNDATPSLFDIDNDGRLDLIVGNSTGNLFLFRNHSENNTLSFIKDPSFFKGLNLGMYVAPSVTAQGDKVILIAGNSMGKLYILEKTKAGKSSWHKDSLNISLSSFASPAFIKTGQSRTKDLLLSDGDGQLYYFQNKKNNYRVWGKSSNFFSERIFPGPACVPAIFEINGGLFMISGNINGELKLFENKPSPNRLPWVERPDFFRGIKLSSFSRGIITEWNGKYLLITGQQDGFIKAFLNSGSFGKPLWIEQKQFFRGIPKIMHASPTVFDIDGDGKWELITGDVDGFVRGYCCKITLDGKPVWEMIQNSFANVKVARYSVPSFFKYSNKIYLFVGQENGRVVMFSSEISQSGPLIFDKEDYLAGIKVNNHSAPSAFLKDGLIEVSIGDYDGNLKHFTCKENVE